MPAVLRGNGGHAMPDMRSSMPISASGHRRPECDALAAEPSSEIDSDGDSWLALRRQPGA